VFHLREETENFKLTDVEEIRFIELPKMLKNWERGQLKEEEDPLTKWFLLLEAKKDQKIARALEVKAMNDAILEKAIKEWQRLSQDPKTRAQYLSRLKGKMDYFSSMKTAESRGMEKGMEKGEVKGKIEAKQDAICQFLFKRFGLDPAGIQEKVRQLTNLEILDGVLTQLFAAGSPEEAQHIIEEGLNKSLPQA
jgi:predicted transposase/invertase (TIGR01784 family)